MKKRWISNLILLAVVTIIGFVIIRQPGVEQPVSLPTASNAELAIIKIQRPQHALIEIVKIDQQWQIVKPFSAPANPAITNVLTQLAQMPAHKQFEQSSDNLKNFDLAQPKACVWLNAKRLCFGTQHAIRPWRYVALDNKIYLVEDKHFALLSSPAHYYADPHPLSDKDNVIAVFKGNQGFSLSSHGLWLQENVLAPISEKMLTQVASNWQKIKAENVQLYNGEELPTSFSLLIEGHEKPVEFSVKEQGSGFSLIRNGLEYQFKHEHWPLLWPYK